jgi:hypothetical protein
MQIPSCYLMIVLATACFLQRAQRLLVFRVGGGEIYTILPIYTALLSSLTSHLTTNFDQALDTEQLRPNVQVGFVAMPQDRRPSAPPSEFDHKLWRLSQD